MLVLYALEEAKKFAKAIKNDDLVSVLDAALVDLDSRAERMRDLEVAHESISADVSYLSSDLEDITKRLQLIENGFQYRKYVEEWDAP